jgi:hypothetical protein
MAKKQKEKVTTKTRRDVEVSTESILEFCHDILTIFDRFGVENEYDSLTAIIGLETLGRNISRVIGLDEDARRAILQTADPIISKVVDYFQVEADEKVVVTSVQQVDSKGCRTPIYFNADNEKSEKEEDTENSLKKPMSQKARVRVGSPIFFMNDLGRNRY